MARPAVAVVHVKVMSLSTGQTLGCYRILARLGSGGMGEVWRAVDTRLDREVALKVLPEGLVDDPERRARFEREAKVLASLNHPHIATLHALEHLDGRHVLVMELVEGEGLDAYISRGAIPVDEALPIALQIAEALEAAHERGVVHRDLKPANVRLRPDGAVKVLDFGLAKSIVAPAGLFSATTLSTPTTQIGAILGTPAYMSPEQARGQPVGAAGDVWAFGCLLYEMLSGRRAFSRPTIADTLAAVLVREADWSALPPETPAAVADLLRRCLEKDAARRPADGAALVAALADAAAPPAAAAPVARRLRQLTFAEELEEAPVFAPDGESIAFTRELGGVRRIVVLDLTSGAERELTRGSHDDLRPTFTPDGRSLLFMRSREAGRRLEPRDIFGSYDGADIFALEIESGRERRLVENAANPALSPDGRTLAFDASWAGPLRLWQADARGRNPRQLTSDASEAVAHLRPRWSPDGRHLVFQNLERTRFDIRTVAVASGELTWITHDAVQDVAPTWCPTGRHIYFTSARGGGLNIWRVPVSDGRPAGALQQATMGAGVDVDASVSGDGRRLIFSILRQNADLWRLPLDPASGLAAGPPSRLIGSPREESRAAWSPDGRFVAFNSDRAGDMNLWLLEAASGALRRLTDGDGGDYQPRFSPDGTCLTFFSSRGGSADIWAIELASGELTRLTDGPSIDVNPTFSRDGRHIAFMSDPHGPPGGVADGRRRQRPARAHGRGRHGALPGAAAGRLRHRLPLADGIAAGAQGGVLRRGAGAGPRDRGRGSHVVLARRLAHPRRRGAQGPLGLAARRRRAGEGVRVRRARRAHRLSQLVARRALGDLRRVPAAGRQHLDARGILLSRAGAAGGGGRPCR